MRSRKKTFLLAMTLLAMTLGTCGVLRATAQIVLPGAAPPAPIGTTEKPPPRVRSPRSDSTAPIPHAPIHVPSVSSILGKPLLLNGSTSEIVFAQKDGFATKVAKGKDPPPQPSIVATRLGLMGELISKPGDPCRVDIKPTGPIETKSLGHPAGVARFQLELASCPFSFDLLEGAILPTKETQSCAFKSADCQVNIGGMWGPRGRDIGPAQIKELERSRAQADLASRATFRELLKRTKGNAEIKKLASEQAAFSSLREETCRTYDMESAHGFCGTRLTEARVAALQAQVETAPPQEPKKGHGKRSKN